MFHIFKPSSHLIDRWLDLWSYFHHLCQQCESLHRNLALSTKMSWQIDTSLDGLEWVSPLFTTQPLNFKITTSQSATFFTHSTSFLLTKHVITRHLNFLLPNMLSSDIFHLYVACYRIFCYFTYSHIFFHRAPCYYTTSSLFKSQGITTEDIFNFSVHYKLS